MALHSLGLREYAHAPRFFDARPLPGMTGGGCADLYALSKEQKMDDLLQNLPQVLLIGFMVLCVVPSLLLTLAAILIVRRLTTFASPDVSAMKRTFEKAQASQPQAPKAALVQQVIHQQAVRCGILGAVTSVGGFVTLPVALPLDILVSARIQAGLLQFIAESYGHGDASKPEVEIRTALVMTGGLRATESTFNLVMRFAVRILGKSFAKVVPVLGAVVGFAVNYATARAMGTLALRWYARNSAA